MTMLRAFVAIASTLVVLLLLAGYLLPGELYVERTLTVQAEPEAVYSLVNSGEGWGQWTSWIKEFDPSWKGNILDGPTEGVGMRYKWQTNKLGGGVITITVSEAPKHVAYTMRQLPSEQELQGQFRVEAVAEGGCRVSWSEGTTIEGSIGRWMALASKGRIATNMDKTLGRLRDLAETPGNVRAPSK